MSAYDTLKNLFRITYKGLKRNEAPNKEMEQLVKEVYLLANTYYTLKGLQFREDLYVDVTNSFRDVKGATLILTSELLKRANRVAEYLIKNYYKSVVYKQYLSHVVTGVDTILTEKSGAKRRNNLIPNSIVKIMSKIRKKYVSDLNSYVTPLSNNKIHSLITVNLSYIIKSCSAACIL